MEGAWGLVGTRVPGVRTFRSQVRMYTKEGVCWVLGWLQRQVTRGDRRSNPRAELRTGLLQAGACRVGLGDKLEVTAQTNDSGWCPGREART